MTDSSDADRGTAEEPDAEERSAASHTSDTGDTAGDARGETIEAGEPAETTSIEVAEFYDALEDLGRPLTTASGLARALSCTQEEANRVLETLAAEGHVERADVENDPVVWYPTDWTRTVDRERVVLFPDRREIVLDKPTQFTRAQLSTFAHLVTTTEFESYVYEVRREDVWHAPQDSLEALLTTVRQVLRKRSASFEEWITNQWKRANQFVLRTHPEGYTVLEARSADLMGNVARQKLDDGQLRASLSDTESWAAEETTAEIKRTLYEAGYPVRDERDLEEGDPLSISLNVSLREYQAHWVREFAEKRAGVFVGPPGSGKTIAALGALADVEGETLILVPSRELAAQWREEVLAHTSLSPEQVGEYHGGEKNVRPVTIATYHTAGMDRHRQLFDQRRWGLIIYDECLAGETVVETPEGRTTFAELDERCGFDEGWNHDVDSSVLTYDPSTNEYVWDDVTGVYKTEAPVQRIETATGKTLRATAGHTHLVLDPETCEITEKVGVEDGDLLLQPIPTPSTESSAPESRQTDQAKAELIGRFIGDGHMNRYGDVKFAFGRRPNEQAGIVTDLCDRIEVEYSVFENSRGDVTVWVPKLRDVLDWQGASGNKARTVAVPNAAYQWPARRIGALLRGLFGAEGSVDKQRRIQFNSVSERLVSDVSLLLQKLGILSRRMRIERTNEGHSDIYRLTIPSFYNDRFETYVGFRLEHKAERIETGVSPATGLSVGPFLRSLKADLDLSNQQIASMCDVSGGTISDVIRGRYRLGQPRLHALASSLREYANGPISDPERTREQYNVTYERLGSELRVSVGSAYRRFTSQREDALDGVRDIVKRRRYVASVYADRLSRLTGLCALEVTDVSDDGVETVYDFETASHTFVADGFLTHNCQHIPSTVFRRSADLQTRHRLGLSATPIREDDKEEEIYTLIGPPIGTDWESLFEAGFVAEPEVEIRYVPWDGETARNEHASADAGHEKRKLAAMNPAKLEEVRRLRTTHPDAKALVFCEYLDHGEALAEALSAPFVSGEMPHHRRQALFREFREGKRDTLVISRVGDEGIDLPNAEVAIVASGLGGSRRQGTQRAGRTMRPAGTATMYVLATRGTTEEEFAQRQMHHLAAKGVRVRETNVAGEAAADEASRADE